MPRSIARVIKESSALALVLSLSLSLARAGSLSLASLSRALSLSHLSLSRSRGLSLSRISRTRSLLAPVARTRASVTPLAAPAGCCKCATLEGCAVGKAPVCVRARMCARARARASESERERGNERARGSEREESERASSTRRAAALRSRDVLWKSFILCACGPATPPHNLRGCPHGWAAGLLPDRSTSFRALAQPARRWWPQRAGVTQIHSGITQRANSAVQTIRSYAKVRMLRNVTQSHHSTKEVPLPKI